MSTSFSEMFCDIQVVTPQSYTNPALCKIVIDFPMDWMPTTVYRRVQNYLLIYSSIGSTQFTTGAASCVTAWQVSFRDPSAMTFAPMGAAADAASTGGIISYDATNKKITLIFDATVPSTGQYQVNIIKMC